MFMKRTGFLAAVSGIAISLPGIAYGQDGDAANPAEGDGEINEIVVVAQNMRGQVITDQPPIQELDEADIASYGVGSIADLITALAPQTSSARGRGGGFPVILVNGVRISSFREMRSYPPESIQKVEILPEEVALKYGYSADQRVVNLILKNNFSSREIEGEYNWPGAGGTSSKELEATYLVIAGQSRLNINAEWNGTSLLTEAERGIVQSVVPGLATDPDPAAYRSLVDAGSDFELTGNWTTKLGEAGSSLSINATGERSTSRSLSGLDTVELTDPADNTILRTFGADNPLERRNTTTTVSLGSTLNAPIGSWQLTGTIDASHSHSLSEIDRPADTSALVLAAANGTLAIDGPLPALADAGFDTARTVTDQASSQVTVMGSPFYLPAGDVSMTVDAGYSWNRVQGRDTRNPGVETSLVRGDLSAGVNVGIPLTSRRDDVLAGLGDISLNFSGGIDHLSDFGTLTDWSAGATWGITDTLSLQGSFIARDAAPTLSQLGSPEVVTFNVPVYDLTRGETVLVNTIGGGNPDLLRERQRDIRVGLQWDLPFLERSNISIDYLKNRSYDVSASFPLLTPEIEAAFPGRVTRDDTGRLVSIDQRPVTFAQQESSRLRFGLNLSGNFGKAREGGGQPNSPFAAIRAASAPQGGGAQPPASGGTAPGGPDPARFAEMRAKLCSDEGAAVPDISTLPPRMQENLRGADGTVDPARYAEMRQRICSMPEGAPPPGAAAGEPPRGYAPRGGGRGGPGGGMRGPGGGGGPGGDGRGRWSLNLSYSLELENEVLIAEGLPTLDLLDGDALTGGGVVRHSAQLEGGLFYRGFGLRYTGKYSGPSRIDGTGLPGSTDLNFGSLATLDLRMFADLGQQASLVEKVPFFKGSRISFGIDNVFDTYRRVTDANGDVPLRYQPGLIDPMGRTFEIEFRKMF